MSRRKGLRIGLLVGIAAIALAQAVPYGRDHANPPVTRAAPWPAGPGQEIAERSCYDCHSNLTSWPWYSNVAPMSWLVAHDVEEGRSQLDFSDWDRAQPPQDEVAAAVESGEMPPAQYTLVHRSTGLSASERRQLVRALSGLYAKAPPGGG